MKRLAVFALVALAGCGGSKQVVKTTTTRVEVVNARVSRIAELGRGQALFYTHGSVGQGRLVKIGDGLGVRLLSFATP